MQRIVCELELSMLCFGGMYENIYTFRQNETNENNKLTGFLKLYLTISSIFHTFVVKYKLDFYG